MNKNDIYTENIIDNGMKFEGIAKVDNMPIFIPYTLKDEKAKIKILKVNKNYAFAKLEGLLQKSSYRIDPICPVYYRCGGCKAMHIEYTKTLEMKKYNVKNTLRKQNIDENLVENIYGMNEPYNYRNKVQYPVRNINGKTVMGMFSERTHNITEVEKCYIEDKEIDSVAHSIYELLVSNEFCGYNEEIGDGDIKNIMVRKGIHTGDIMCVIVTTKNIKSKIQSTDIVERLLKEYPNIKSIMLNINQSKNNVILSNNNICIYGDEYIKDKIGKYTFKISTNSFFQVNTVQAEKLYSLLKENLKLTKQDNVLELYSGVGSIGIYLADSVKKVYGVEIVEDAVKSAKENLSLNNISNVEYICDDATKAIGNIKEKYDVLVVDPPRKGLDKAGIDIILKIKPEKIGYVSCNPASLVRDMKLLSKDYDIKSINLVDMFPWTTHVESVCMLARKDIEEY